MSNLNIENVYLFLKELLKDLKIVISDSKSENINNILIDRLEIYTKVETAMLYRELVLQEFENAIIIKSLYKQIYDHYVTMLAIVIENSFIERNIDPKLDAIKRKKKEEEITIYSKVWAKLYEKIDYFHLNLLLNDFLKIKTKPCFEANSSKLVDIIQIVKFFPKPQYDLSFKHIENSISKKLVDLERADVLNDTVFYTVNNIENYLVALTKFEEFLSFSNLLLFIRKDMLNAATENHSLIVLALNIFFYATDMLVKLRKNKNGTGFMEKDEIVTEVIQVSKEIQKRVVTYLQLEFNYALETQKSKANPKDKTKKLISSYNNSFGYFFSVLIKKLSTTEHERPVTLRAVKYIMRNCKKMNDFIKEASLDYNFHSEVKSFNEHKRVLKVYKTAVTKKANKKDGDIVIKEDKLDTTKKTEAANEAKTGNQEAHKLTTATNIMIKMNNLRTKKEKVTHTFKFNEDNKLMYEDEYDDTLDVYANTDMRYRTNDIDGKLKITEFEEELETNYDNNNDDGGDKKDGGRQYHRRNDLSSNSRQYSQGQQGYERKQYRKDPKGSDQPYGRKNDADNTNRGEDEYVQRKTDDQSEKNQEPRDQRDFGKKGQPNDNNYNREQGDQESQNRGRGMRADLRNFKPNTHTAKAKK